MYGQFRNGAVVAAVILAWAPHPAQADMSPRRIGSDVEILGATPPLRVHLLDAGPGERLSVRIVQVGDRRVVDLRAMNAAGDRGSAWIAEPLATGPRLIWTGPVGALDADAENWIDVHVTAEAIEEVQGASRLVGCDQKSLRLFPRRWDFARQEFIAVASTQTHGATLKIQAKRSDPVSLAKSRFRVVGVSSILGGERKATALVVPQSLDDDDAATGWRSGEGPGRGETIVARSGGGIEQVSAVRLMPGLVQSLAAFRSTARPVSLTLILGPADNQKFEVQLIGEPPATDLSSVRRPFLIPLPHPVATSCVQIVVGETQGGQKGVAISDFSVVTAVTDAAAVVNRLAQDDHPDCAQAGRTLGIESTGAAERLRGAIESASAGSRQCLLAAFAGAMADPVFAKAAQADAIRVILTAVRGASADEESALRQIVATTQPGPVSGLQAIITDKAVTSDDQVRAVRILGSVTGDQAHAALLDLVGRGSPEVRQAIRGFVAGRRAADLVAAYTDTPDDQILRRSDLALSLGVAAKREKAEAVPAALLKAAHDPREPFTVRARAIEAIGRIGIPESLTFLMAVRNTDPDPVLRLFAIQGLTEQPGAAATAALRDALVDNDPRVRDAAATELGVRRDASARDLLIAGAKQEPWPRVRRAQVTALGRICGGGVDDLLSRAVERDGDEVRRSALAGLVSCHVPQARATLLRVAGRARESAAMRARAVALIADLGDAAAAPELRAAIERMRIESQADMALEPVLGEALQVLGLLSKGEAQTAAASLIGDHRPGMRRFAVDALDAACDAQNRKTILGVLDGITNDPDEAVAQSAQAAALRCRTR